VIRRRHVLYVEGYDPQGATGYHRLFGRELRRFLSTWSLAAKLGALAIDSNDLAHWTIETTGPNWQVATRFEFLRLESVISANLAQPIARQVLRAVRWSLGDLFTGTSFKIFRASWPFGLHLIGQQILLLTWVALSMIAGALAARFVGAVVDLPALVTVLLAAMLAVAIFAALMPLAERWFVIRVTNGWPYLRETSRGDPSVYDRPVDIFAARVVAVARAAEADEIVVIGHSAGGVTSAAVIARALELDPGLGRHGPRMIYLTVGSLAPGFLLHPAAGRLRAMIKRIAIEPGLLWIECQARQDIMNFWDFDPVKGTGIDAGPDRCNPLIWKVSFRDMLRPEFFRRNRFNFFRLHYQYIMGNDKRGPYDFFMLVCGPVSVEDWARHDRAMLAAFGSDGSFGEDRVIPPATA
jgi:pimeloyl-ACP methyl ester carboxylesterase